MKLFIVAAGGLANRMRAVASGLALARKTGRHPVVIWHRDRGLNARFGDIFSTENLPFELREIPSAVYSLIYEKPRKKNLYISKLTGILDRKLRIFQDVNGTFESDIAEIERIVSSCPRDVIIHSGLIFSDIDSNLMNEIFRCSPAVKQRIAEISGGRKFQATLQIRRTDNRQSISGSPDYLFERKAEEIIDKDPEAQIFLATDDEDTKKRFATRFPRNIHFNQRIATRSTREGIIDAAAELYIMASSECIYGSYWSSFSEIAALIGSRNLIVVRQENAPV